MIKAIRQYGPKLITNVFMVIGIVHVCEQVTGHPYFRSGPAVLYVWSVALALSLMWIEARRASRQQVL